MAIKHKLLDEITCDQPCHKGDNYCILKEMMKHDVKYNNRLVMQSACVNKFKYEESKRQQKDIGWNIAYNLWVEKGYAKAFGDLYNEDDSLTVLYNKVIKSIK